MPVVPAPHLHEVFLTRPQGRNEDLCRMLEDAGLQVHVFPALETRLLDTAVPEARPGNLHVFVSRQAVAACFRNHGKPWPSGAWACAVGQTTAAALREHVPASCILAPGPQSAPDSESLLAEIDALGLRPAQAHILRAGNGRDWLAQQLAQRGWHIAIHAVYSRKPVLWDYSSSQKLAGSSRGILLVTSQQSLASIAASLEHHTLRWPRQLAAVTLHARIARRLQYVYAQHPGTSLCTRISSPDDRAIFQAILAVSGLTQGSSKPS